jgi:4-hydroxy-tetrahydrodipicolinate synthase
MEFRGVFTAIITPFDENGKLDEECLKQLIDFNISNGVCGIVPCGTTGESPTLTHEEHDRVIELTINHVNKRVPVIAGTGSNSTAEAVRLSQQAEAAGADALLVVNPYYNKPTQEGLYRHFKAVANSVRIPIVLYNIKGRTGVNVETSTLMRIVGDCQNVLAVKEASGDLEQMKDVISKRPQGFSVLSGDDGITLDLIKEGGNGVISVASNLVPDKMSKMVSLALEGNFDEASKLNSELDPLFDVEFIETNPIPIKCALSFKGMCKEAYRLPMCELRPENKEKLKQVLTEMEVI